MANKVKKCRKGEKFTFSAQIKKLTNKWWETIISVYEPLFRNPVCTSFPK